ncbi:MAG: glycosyltransferase family 2 protein [Gordonia polyisoprenivorans]|nr:glycosyltransferase family 2 protein [Gordonia polyisoprenivorans]
MSVAVITVSYHSEDVLPALIQSVAGASRGATQVVVVNNDTEHRGLAERVPPGVQVVESDTNAGYGAGMNRGASIVSDAQWLLLVNPDVVLLPSAIDELLATGAEDERVGVVGPRILTPAGEVYPSARRLPSLRTGIGHALFARIWRTNPWTAAYLEERQSEPVKRDAGWLSGSCLLVRRAAFDEVHGFDERFFMYFEDVDLCARLGRRGWRIVYDPLATITHSGGTSTDTVGRPMVRAHHRSAYRYMSRKYAAWWLLPLRVALRAGLWARSWIVSR